MSSPSISVMNCGKALSRASTLRQSWLVCQYCASCWTVASRTPCDSSATVSFSGQRVAAMRRRRSTSSSCGTSMRKGRIALPCAAPSARALSKTPVDAEAARPSAPAAAVVARTLRRVGDDDFSDMLVPLGLKGRKYAEVLGAVPSAFGTARSYQRMRHQCCNCAASDRRRVIEIRLAAIEPAQANLGAANDRRQRLIDLAETRLGNSAACRNRTPVTGV